MAGQLWVTDSLGGYMYSDQLSAELRTAVQPLCRFRQFADVKDAAHQGMGKGDTFHWNVYSDVATQGTTLLETDTVPETNFTISQGTLTITEAANSVPYTGKLDDLSEHPVKEVIHKVLKNDARKAFDSLAQAQFAATPLRVTPAAASGTVGTDTSAIVLSTTGTSTMINNVALGKEHIKTIVDTMKERNIPAYQGDDYFALARPSTYRTLKNNLETIHQYVDRGFGMILSGEIGRYEGVRFVEQTNIGVGVGSTAGAGTWGNAKSDTCLFFGEDTVAEAIAIPEEIRGRIPSDYGRSKGIAWYYLGSDSK